MKQLANQELARSTEKIVSILIALCFAVFTAAAPAAVPGKTQVNLSVGSGGSAEIAIPIITPPGVAGLTPKVNLTYSSRSGNGPLGMGWNITGVSAIGRCARNLTFDNQIRGVKFDQYDYLCLGGQRLVKIKGTYGKDKALYRTKIDNFTLVEQVGDLDASGQYFIGHTKSGQKYYFGNTDDSKIEIESGDKVRLWNVNEIQDVSGNKIKFTYTSWPDETYFRLGNIQYAFSNQTNFHAWVWFRYEDRLDRHSGYYNGNKAVKDFHRVSNIITATNYTGAVREVKDYRLTYESEGVLNLSRLKSIQECSGRSTSASCYEPVAFEWSSHDDSYIRFDNVSTITQFQRWNSVTPGDFNGDGYSDFLINTDTNGQNAGWQTYLNNKNGTFRYAGSFTPFKDWHSATPGDFNGDGQTDFMINTATRAENAGWRVYLSNGDGTFRFSWSVSQFNEWHSVTPGDFNGDGLTDFLINTETDGVGAGWRCYLSDGDGTFTNAGSFSQFRDWHSARAGDFDGDGLTDFIINTITQRSDAGWRVYLSNGNGTFRIGSSLTQFIDWDVRAAADYNADGLTDFLVDTATNGTGAGWRCYLSKGDGTFINAGSFTQFHEWHSPAAADFNGDGFTDFMINTRTDGTHAGWHLYLATGNGKFSFNRSLTRFKDWHSATPTDFNGDGLTDFMINSRTDGDSAGWLLYENNSLDPAPRNRIVKVTDSLGNNKEISYAPLTDPTVYSVSDTEAQYPVVDVNFPMYIVDKVMMDNGVGSQNETTYTYKGAKIDLHGLGFLGFEKITAEDKANNLITETQYNQTFPFLGMISNTRTKEKGKNFYLTQTVSSFDSIEYPAGYVFPFVENVREYVKEVNGQAIKNTETVYEYYNTGDSKSIDTTVTGGGKSFNTYTFNTYSNRINYNSTPIVYQLGRLARTEVTKQIGTEEGKKVSAFEYYDDGRLEKEIIEPDSDEFRLTTTYEYDEFGNTKKKTYSGGDGLKAVNRIERVEFDEYGLFPRYTFNALGEFDTSEYDPAHGVLTSIIGPNQLESRFYYDEFGRLTREESSDGSVKTIEREWYDGSISFFSNGKLQETIEELGSPAITSIADSMGREIGHYTYVLDGSYTAGVEALSFVKSEYNKLGQITNKTQPFFATYFDRVESTTFTYDILGRVLTQTDSRGQVRYVYEGLTTTGYNRLDQKNKKVSNAIGQLIKSIDNNNKTTTYTYDVFGNQHKVIDSKNNVIEVRHDIRGNKYYSKDPDMGVWTYQYNALGELIQQTDANLNITKYKYDGVGRLIKKEDPECSSFWVYGSATNVGLTGNNAIGKLVYSQRGNVEKNYLRYDSKGRIKSEKKVLFDDVNKTFEFEYEYDQFSRLKKVEYPETDVYQDGLKITYVYDSHGNLLKVVDHELNTHWYAKKQNARGQLREYSTANNRVSTLNNYDSVHGLLTYVTTGNSSSYRSIQHLEFGWDEEGRLSNRIGYEQTEEKFLTETFTYDSLNRLKTSSVSGLQESKTYTYDELGNITSKTGLGSYVYHPTIRPHAVTSVNGEDYFYDNNGNLTETRSQATGSIIKEIEWTPYNKPKSIRKGASYSNFIYGVEQQRIKQESNSKTNYYVNSLFEIEVKVNTQTAIHYIKAGDETIVLIKSSLGSGQYGSAASKETRYLYKDHLGSIEAITDEYGNLIEQLSYDPHGKRRKSDWSDTSSDFIALDTDRGFTGHEHLDEVGLIHMNGRVYDPVIGRFISADPYVQFPDNGQSLNRYSYVLNNPLSYTDPSGFGIIGAILDAIVGFIYGGPAGAAINVAIGQVRDILIQNQIIGSFYQIAACAYNVYACTYSAAQVTQAQGGSVGDTFKSAAIAFASAQAFHGVDATEGIVKVVAHGTIGGVRAELSGNDFMSGFYSAAAPAGFAESGGYDLLGIKGPGADLGGVDIAKNAAVSAVIGGVAAELGGDKFANGAVTGAFSRLYNDLNLTGVESEAVTQTGINYSATAGGITSKALVRLYEWFKSLKIGKSSAEIAKEGGKHSGLRKEFLKQTPKQLEKTIKSFNKKIELHKGWIKDPTSKVPKFNSLSKEHQHNLIHHWKQDIIRLREQRSIAQDILKNYGK